MSSEWWCDLRLLMMMLMMSSRRREQRINTKSPGGSWEMQLAAWLDTSIRTRHEGWLIIITKEKRWAIPNLTYYLLLLFHSSALCFPFCFWQKPDACVRITSELVYGLPCPGWEKPCCLSSSSSSIGQKSWKSFYSSPSHSQIQLGLDRILWSIQASDG